MSNKKVGVVLFTFLILSIISAAIISAQAWTSEEAYSCFESKAKGRCLLSASSFEDKIFTLLALSYKRSFQSECKPEIYALSKNDGECWPKSSCKIKDTALAVIALNNVGENTTKAENWLLSKKMTTELNWFLEIDTTGKSVCDIWTSRNPVHQQITLEENKKITAGSLTCLSPAYSNYWLQIQNDPDCLKDTYFISCDKDFLSTLLYQNPSNTNVWYVSNQVGSAGAKSWTSHNISFYCFGQDSCDYEGSLWATLALSRTSHKIIEFIPYLKAFAEDNSVFFPYSFLNLFEKGSYIQEINNIQGYPPQFLWDSVGGKTVYYDTALAFLGLGGYDRTSKKPNLLEAAPTGTNCLNGNIGIADTGFLLWAGWPRTAVLPLGECEANGYYCLSEKACNDTTLGGLSNHLLEQFDCSGTKICCDSKPLNLKTCSELPGTICQAGEGCTEDMFAVNDTDYCCTGTCFQRNCTIGRVNSLNGILCTGGKVCNQTALSSAEGDCCKGTCVYPNCTLIGEVCNKTSLASVCANETIFTADEPTLPGCCLTKFGASCITKNCTSTALNGKICNSSNNLVCNLATFNTPDTDSSADKCCPSTGTCVQDCAKTGSFCLGTYSDCSYTGGTSLTKYCSSGICCSHSYTPSESCSQLPAHGSTYGKICQEGYRCSTSDIVTATDGDCCFGDCLQSSCYNLNGSVCDSNYACVGGNFVNSTDSSRCCLGGECTIHIENINCEDEGFFCTSTGECESTGDNLLGENYECSNRKVCCRVEPPVPDQTCSELKGKECTSDQLCSQATVYSKDTSECCIGTCEEQLAQTECETEGYSCKDSCAEDEEEAGFACNNQQCCKIKETVSKSYWWVWVLAILIILVVLGIIFRDKLRVFIFNLKNKFSKGKGSQPQKKGPPFMPPTMQQQRMPMRYPQRAPPVSKTDKELDETLKKLREMSK